MATRNQPFVAASTTREEDLRAAKQEWSERLLLRPAAQSLRFSAFAAAATPTPDQNVVGVGIGEKLVDAKPTGIQALKFLVRIKYPEAQLESKDLLPKTVNGLPVDVEQVGVLRRFPRVSAQNGTMPNPRVKMRPAQPGDSVGFADPNNQFVMAGTFGALVKKNGDLYLLSNNHVLADENQLPLGSPIFQPGLLDGGHASTDQIAEFTRAVKLRAGVLNKVDGAIAKALDQSLVSNEILFIGAPQGKTRAQIDMIVHKFGRTTGYRAGRVTSVATDVRVQYETGEYSFQDQILIVGLNGQPFSDAGDSGSLILERSTRKAVGLLFAGSSTHTIANHIDDVLRALRVTLA